jgi:hypothetical protein
MEAGICRHHIRRSLDERKRVREALRLSINGDGLASLPGEGHPDRGFAGLVLGHSTTVWRDTVSETVWERLDDAGAFVGPPTRVRTIVCKARDGSNVLCSKLSWSKGTASARVLLARGRRHTVPNPRVLSVEQ